MVTEVEVTVWNESDLCKGREKVKDQDVDETYGKSEGVYNYDYDGNIADGC